MHKYNELDNVKIKSTNEMGIIVDVYKHNDEWYYQVELDIKTDGRDIIECKESDLIKIGKDAI